VQIGDVCFVITGTGRNEYKCVDNKQAVEIGMESFLIIVKLDTLDTGIESNDGERRSQGLWDQQNNGTENDRCNT